MEACFQAAAIGIRMVADKGVEAQWVSAEAFESPSGCNKRFCAIPLEGETLRRKNYYYKIKL